MMHEFFSGLFVSSNASTTEIYCFGNKQKVIFKSYIMNKMTYRVAKHAQGLHQYNFK
jgi:hypothetical protein